MRRTVLIGILVLGFFVSNLASAAGDFYVIPVGGTNIKPSDVVELFELLTNPGSTATWQFTAPQGKVLVVTSIHLGPRYPGAGTLSITLYEHIGALARIRAQWALPNTETKSFHYAPGFIFGSGNKLSVSNAPSSSGPITFQLFGYLADDR